jgi:hypothetical protein
MVQPTETWCCFDAETSRKFVPMDARALVPTVDLAAYFLTKCDQSFSFSAQTFSKMSSLGSRI